MILLGTIESLIDFFSFTVWIFYGMSMLALLVLRKNNPNLARPYKVINRGLKMHWKKFAAKERVLGLALGRRNTKRMPLLVVMSPKVCYPDLFTFLVRWHAGAVSLPMGDVIMARQVCP
jgi:hypothetical protein